MDAVEKAAKADAPQSQIYIQPVQQGTADAVLAAREALDAHGGDVIVLYADTPLIREQTIARLRERLNADDHDAILEWLTTGKRARDQWITQRYRKKVLPP